MKPVDTTMDKPWEAELIMIHDKGCTDSDIEDFVNSHPDVPAQDIWEFWDAIDAPLLCKGCKHVAFVNTGMYPCNRCTRSQVLIDFYERKTK